MTPRLITAAVSTFVAAASLAAVSATPASAAGSCTLTAPSQVSIWKPSQPMTLTAAGVCTSAGGSGAWSLTHPSYGTQYFVRFDGVSSRTWQAYDWRRLGLQTWSPSGAHDANHGSASQNAPKTDIRLDAASWIGAARSGSTVSVTGTALAYSPTHETYSKRAGATGVLQYLDQGSSTWKTLRTVTTGSSGTATFSYTTSATRSYRFGVYSTSTIWSKTSAAVTK